MQRNEEQSVCVFSFRQSRALVKASGGRSRGRSCGSRLEFSKTKICSERNTEHKTEQRWFCQREEEEEQAPTAVFTTAIGPERYGKETIR